MSRLQRILGVALLAVLVGCGGTSRQTEADDSVSEVPTDTADARPPAGPEVVDKSVRPRAERPAGPTSAADEGAARVRRAEVKSFRRRGPAYLLTLLAFEPVHGKEGFQGFKIVQAAPNASSFMGPHIKLGDVVTHVNGIRVERPDDYLQAWNTLEDAAVIRVDFFRKDQPMHVSWVVED